MDPIECITLSGKEIVYDIVASPLITPLIERAKKHGCSVIYGIEMLFPQAYEQFRLMTGSSFPVKVKEELNELFKSSPT